MDADKILGSPDAPTTSNAVASSLSGVASVAKPNNIEELAALVRETYNADPVIRARWDEHFPEWPNYTRLVRRALTLDETIRMAQKALPVLRRVREAKAARREGRA